MIGRLKMSEADFCAAKTIGFTKMSKTDFYKTQTASIGRRFC
ncbi:hypothetical protein ACOR62_00525 [Neisseria lisongii]